MSTDVNAGGISYFQAIFQEFPEEQRKNITKNVREGGLSSRATPFKTS
jgi:hypothetical protein